MRLNLERSFPVGAQARNMIRPLHEEVKNHLIILPHSYADPCWYFVVFLYQRNSFYRFYIL